jgi:DNA oxidative demethylase
MLPNGIRHFSNFYDRASQEQLVHEIRECVRQAPLFTPLMPKTGKAFSVRMSNCGSLGWVSDIQGYRYQAHHPETQQPWPAMPESLLSLWHEYADYPHPPEACLINFYQPHARMGLHQDRDEQDFDAPVLSVSLGNSAVFRLGGLKRNDPTQSIQLHSGDVLSFGGPARLIFHGIDRIIAGSSDLLAQGGRINLTLRRVTKPA